MTSRRPSGRAPYWLPIALERWGHLHDGQDFFVRHTLVFAGPQPIKRGRIERAPKTFTVWGGQRIARAPALGILDLRWEVQWSWRERPDDWDRSHGRDDAERPSSQTCLSPLMWRSLRAPSAIGDASSKPAPV